MAEFPFKVPFEILYVSEERFRETERGADLGDVCTAYTVITDDKRHPENAGSNLKLVYDFARYTGEVANGGHGQFLDNCQPSIESLRDILNLIEKFGNAVYASIFADYLDYVLGLPPGKDHRDGSFTGHPSLAFLDKRYFAQWYDDPLENHAVRYLRQLDWVRPVPDSKFRHGNQLIGKLREAKYRMTMPTPEQFGRFINQTITMFAAHTAARKDREK